MQNMPNKAWRQTSLIEFDLNKSGVSYYLLVCMCGCVCSVLNV